jgi:hypothetical protein
MTENRILDCDPIMIEDDRIDDVDHALNPLGWFYRHNAMHAGTTPMVLDEFGRCARCVRLGFGNRTPSFRCLTLRSKPLEYF